MFNTLHSFMFFPSFHRLDAARDAPTSSTTSTSSTSRAEVNGRQFEVSIEETSGIPSTFSQVPGIKELLQIVKSNFTTPNPVVLLSYNRIGPETQLLARMSLGVGITLNLL